MKLHYRLWIVFSIFWLIGMVILYSLITPIYEKRSLKNSEQLALSEGYTISNRIEGLYPKFPERAEGYLDYYSGLFSTRIFVLDFNFQVVYDAFQEIEPGDKLSVEVLDQTPPAVHYTHTENFGYVQYSLLALHGGADGYILLIKDINGVYEDVTSFRSRVLFYVAIASVAGFFLFYFVASWFTRPLRMMNTHLKRVTPQRRRFAMKYRGNDEIGELVDQIRFMVKQIEAYEQRQRRFISTSSHELKTPLATIQLIAENLPDLRNDEAMHREYLLDLRDQISKMRRTIQGMLQVYRMADKPLQRRTITMEEIKAHVEEQFRHMSESKQIRILFGGDGNGLYADPGLFFPALDNLLSNALIYSPAQREINLSLHDMGGETLCRVCDQGYGIDPADVPYIFEPFYRSNKASGWNQEGSGLGLAIVQQMMELHEGSIHVESKPGEGTCFELFFPRNKTVTSESFS
ncbi:sensor histidine kinase [Marinicrinis lubricantis]|uniref:histidine kinase n=1 Tax=Marinicrinis lubricantis TaxID=2086470 RepID=A0ABW1IVE1_9BACL